MSKFKIGDKYRVISGNGDIHEHAFALGEVVEFTGDYSSITNRPEFRNKDGLEQYLKEGAVKLYEFTKSDLKDGMRVELRCGLERFYLQGSLLDISGSYEDMVRSCEDFYNEDLTHPSGPLIDIIRVTDRDETVVFEREPAIDLSKLELESVCANNSQPNCVELHFKRESLNDSNILTLGEEEAAKAINEYVYEKLSG